MKTILERLADGDGAAADECVREYGGLVWRLARRYLGASSAEVEDGVQDVFVEIWLNAGRFDPAKGREAAFVATLAHRRLIDRQRRVVVHTRVHRKLAANADGYELPSGTDGMGGESESVRRAFNELPAVEREALWMSVFGGLSHREIAEATEVPVGTVKSRLRRAMSRLVEVVGRGRSVGAEGGSR